MSLREHMALLAAAILSIAALYRYLLPHAVLKPFGVMILLVCAIYLTGFVWLRWLHPWFNWLRRRFS